MSHDILDQIYQLNRAGESFAVATVVRVEKPISAKPGDRGIIKSDGSLEGWVGGGCAQDVVIREAKKTIREAQPRLLRLVGSGAIADKSEGVLEFPITCHSGGTMDVYIEPVLPRPQLDLAGQLSRRGDAGAACARARFRSGRIRRQRYARSISRRGPRRG